MNEVWEVKAWADSLEREGGVAIVMDPGLTLMEVPSPKPLEMSRLELAQRLVKDHNAMLRLRPLLENLIAAGDFLQQCKGDPDSSATGAMGDASEWWRDATRALFTVAKEGVV